MSRETRRWDLSIEERRAGSLGYLPDYFNTWAQAEARALGHRLLCVKNFAQGKKGSKVVLSADVDLDVNARAEEKTARAKEAIRQRELRRMPKITEPVKVRHQCEVDRFRLQDWAGYYVGARRDVLLPILEKRYMEVASSWARNQGAKVAYMSDFCVDEIIETQGIRMSALLDMIPWDEDAERKKERDRMMNMQAQYYGTYDPALDGVATATEIRAKQREYEYRVRDAVRRGNDIDREQQSKWDQARKMADLEKILSPINADIWNKAFAKEYAAVFDTEIFKRIDAKPAPPALPPEPVKQTRALDLDEAAPVAMPAQKGRVIDLE